MPELTEKQRKEREQLEIELEWAQGDLRSAHAHEDIQLAQMRVAGTKDLLRKLGWEDPNPGSLLPEYPTRLGRR